MGLDMFLFRAKRQPNKTFNDIKEIESKLGNQKCTEKELEELKPFIFEEGSTETFKWKSLYHEIGYWRKANQIHQWFVDNVQAGEDDCGVYIVPKEKAEELLDICKKVYDSLKDAELVEKTMYDKWNNEEYTHKVFADKDTEIAEDLLPTQEGFFFGGTEYDEYYLEDIERTIKQLRNVLVDFDFENNYLLYHSSW